MLRSFNIDIALFKDIAQLDPGQRGLHRARRRAVVPAGQTGSLEPVGTPRGSGQDPGGLDTGGAPRGGAGDGGGHRSPGLTVWTLAIRNRP